MKIFKKVLFLLSAALITLPVFTSTGVASAAAYQRNEDGTVPVSEITGRPQYPRPYTEFNNYGKFNEYDGEIFPKWLFDSQRPGLSGGKDPGATIEMVANKDDGSYSSTQLALQDDQGNTYNFDNPTDATNYNIDPYFKKDLALTYKTQVKLTNLVHAMLTLLGSYGLHFTALVKVPDGYTAQQVVNAFNNSTHKSELKIFSGDATKTWELNKDILTVADDHTLKLQLTQYNSSGLANLILGALQNVGDGFVSYIPVNFNLFMDIDTLASEGDPYDISPNKSLTSNRQFPSIDNKTSVGVTFFDSTKSDQGSVKKGLLWYTTDSYYPNDGLIISPTEENGLSSVEVDYSKIDKNKYYSEGSMTTWRQYISPWDNTGQKNISTADPEIVAGNSGHLDGEMTNRKITLEPTEVFNPADYIRVVDYFTTENKTAGSNVVYANAADGSSNVDPKPGETLTINYFGTGSDGYPLSPMPLTVTRKEYANPNLTAVSTVTNLTKNEGPTDTVTSENGDKVQQIDTFTMNFTDQGTVFNNQKIKVNLPDQTIFDDDFGFKIGDKVYHQSDLDANSQLTVADDQLAWQDDNGNFVATKDMLPNTNYHLALTYQYDVASTGSNKIVTTPNILTIDTPYSVDKTASISPNSDTINIDNSVVTLKSVPTSVDFGVQQVPVGPITYDKPTINYGENLHGIVINSSADTKRQWSISAQLTNSTMPGRLGYKSSSETSAPAALTANPITILTNDDGTKNLVSGDNVFNENQNFTLRIYDFNIPQIGEGDYSGTILWTMNSGPTK